MKDFRTPEQIIRAIMEGQANAATLEYGSDAARDTYAKDTPGQEPGGHTKKHATVLGHSVPAAVDGIPGKGGEMTKPNPERLAGLGKKESYQGNPYLKIANQDIIQENAFEGIVEMSDVEFEDMIEVLTVEELNDLEEGMMSSIGKGIAAVAKGTYKAGKYIAPKIGDVAKKAAYRMSTSGRADAAERKLARIKQNKKDKIRLDTAKSNISKEYAPAKKTVADSYELGSRDYWTQQDELDLAEGKMSPAEVKKHAAAIFKMRQKGVQAKADSAASSAMSAPKSAAAKAARRDAASAGYGKPKSDSADKDTSYKAPKRGRGEKDLPHIVSQLRGVVDTKKGVPSQVKFKDGSTKNVNPKHAQSWLKKHDSAKPQQKLDMYKSHDSHSSFKSYAKEEKEPEYKPHMMYKGDKSEMAKEKKDHDRLKKLGYDHDKPETEKVEEAQRAWDRSSKGRAYRRLSDEEKQRLQKKNQLVRQMRAYKGDDAGYESKGKMSKPTIGKAKSVYKGRQEQIESILDHLAEKYSIFEEKCGPGEYWCTKDMKCKPIPKGMTTDKDGMLVKEEKMTGSEYRQQMAKVSSKSKKVRQAVTNILDKKKDSGSNHADVKAARKYMKVESSSSMDRMADTWNDHADNKHPKVQKHIKKAEKAYNAKDHEGFYHHTQRAADHAYMAKKKPAPVSVKKEEVVNELDSKTLKNYIRKAASPVNKKSAVNLASKGGFKLGKSADHDLDAGEKEDKKAFTRAKGIQRAAKKLYSRTEQVDVQEISKKLAGKYIKRAVGDAISQADKTQYQTSKMFQKQDAGDKKGANKAFKASEEPRRKTMNRFYGIQRAASKMDKKDKDGGNYLAHSMTKQKTSGKVKATEQTVNEISDKIKMSYIKKANKKISDTEHMRDYQNKSMDKMGSISKDDKAFVNKKYDQDTLKRRKGVALAKSKLGEGKKGLWANIHAKRKRGEKMNPKGHPDAPSSKEMKMAQEATADQVTQARYRDQNDNPHTQAYMGKQKKGPMKGMKTYKLIPGKDLESKKGKMAAIKKQIARRPAQYGVDGKHDPVYPANKSTVQKIGKRNKSKATAGQYTESIKKVNEYSMKIAKKININKIGNK